MPRDWENRVKNCLWRAGTDRFAAIPPDAGPAAMVSVMADAAVDPRALALDLGGQAVLFRRSQGNACPS